MQLSRARRRQIEQPSRSEGPLAHVRLSDPILVKRAKDGKARAPEALCERQEEISAASDMPVGTAKCYAHRGRSRLRVKLSDVAW